MSLVITDQILIILAIVFFLIGAYPPSRPGIGWTNLGFACLAATLL